MHILVAGWFSFENMGNTAGDMIARDVVCNWLKQANISYDVAVAHAFSHSGSINLEDADASKYSDLFFVCGPFGNGTPVTELLSRFAHCRITGINLTLLEPLEDWNPFTILYERDSSVASHPDITFYAPPPIVPVVGIILITKQDEYGKRDQHKKAHEAIGLLTKSREMSIVLIDTVLENNIGGLRSPGEIESLISKMDVVITTRLHGTVLSLKNGVPVIPIDSITGGAKLTRQVKIIGWPLLFDVETLDQNALQKAFDYCLTPQARDKAKECANKSFNIIDKVRNNLMEELLAIKNNDIQKIKPFHHKK